MGEEGLVSRVLGLRAGRPSPLPPRAGEAEAIGHRPGQATVRTMRDLYRVEQLNHATRVFGVAGIPSTTPSRR